jgi:predicted dehydrogenase
MTDQLNKTLALGFIGVGWIGRNRMDVLLKSGLAKAALIAEPSADNAAEAFVSAPDAILAASYEEVCENGDVDGIVIATPSALHAQQVLQALNSNKAVFCQKPLARTVAEVRLLAEASSRADKLLHVDLSYRHTKAFQAAYDVVSNGSIGTVYAVDLIFHNAYGPDKDWFFDVNRSGGGCIMDLGIHLIDLAMSTLNFPKIASINSNLFRQGKKMEIPLTETEDFASVMMLTDNNININLQCSWNLPAGKDAVIEAKFYGTSGGAAFLNSNGSFYEFRAEKYLGTETELLFDDTDEWSGRAGLVWAQDVINGKGYDPKSAEEFIKTAEIIDKIYGRQ